jgi:hypothetical protein
VAECGCCGNGRRRSGGDYRPDWIDIWHNWNLTGYDHAGLNADSGNDSTWNCESNPWHGKSDARSGNTGARNNSRDSPDKPDTGNYSGSFNSGNQPHDTSSGDHPGNDDSGDCASCGQHNRAGQHESAKQHPSDHATDHHT